VIGSRLLRWLGVRSYSLYLWHFPIVGWLDAHRVDRIDGPTPAYVVVATVVSIAVSALSYAWIEQPAWRLRVPAGDALGRALGLAPTIR
jgi:peptidoglycan/LPS O-acetylase OafA/YrhL